VEFIVPPKARITKGSLRGIDFPEGAIVGGGTRDNVPFIATADTMIKSGDCVVVFSLPSAFDKVSKFFI
jgi:trk system potassium uptake protein TrkA